MWYYPLVVLMIALVIFPAGRDLISNAITISMYWISLVNSWIPWNPITSIATAGMLYFQWKQSVKSSAKPRLYSQGLVRGGPLDRSEDNRDPRAYITLCNEGVDEMFIKECDWMVDENTYSDLQSAIPNQPLWGISSSSIVGWRKRWFGGKSSHILATVRPISDSTTDQEWYRTFKEFCNGHEVGVKIEYSLSDTQWPFNTSYFYTSKILSLQ